MKTAFLDTSFLDNCLNNAISSNTLNAILAAQKITPVIGIYPTYEIAKNIATSNPQKAYDIFRLIRSLNCVYANFRENLYIMEIKKLTDERAIVDPFLNEHNKKLLNEMVNQYCDGNFNPIHPSFIQQREDWLESMRANEWNPVPSNIYYSKYRHNFYKFIADFHSTIKSRLDRRNWVSALIKGATNEKINLNDIEVLRLVESWPGSNIALRSLIYASLYLVWLTGTNHNKPSIGKFTDALVIIEASYCTAILSHDNGIISNTAKSINPNLEVISYDALMSTVSKNMNAL